MNVFNYVYGRINAVVLRDMIAVSLVSIVIGVGSYKDCLIVI